MQGGSGKCRGLFAFGFSKFLTVSRYRQNVETVPRGFQMNSGGSALEASRDRRAYVLTSQISWGITGALLLVTAMLVALSPMELRDGKFPLNFATFAVFTPVAVIYTYFRYDVRVAALCDSVAALSCFTIIGAVYTYVMTYLGAGMPLWDARFLAADAALGLDWKSYLGWMNAHPQVGWLLNLAYESILKQVALLILLLVVFGQHRRLQGFIIAAQLSIIICGAAAAVTPALGAYPFFGISAADHASIPLTTMDGHVAQVLQLRESAPFFQIDRIEGIIVFPSFHMALVVLFTWGFWRVPVARWIALIVNIAMAAGTPLSGGHYFIDLVGGVVVAVIAIAIASSLQRLVDRVTHVQVVPAAAIVDVPLAQGKPV